MPQNPQFQSSRTQLERRTTKSPRSLLNLCLGVVGSHLEDIIPDLADIALDFPPEIKMVLVAIARRRKLLKDDVIIALADECWEVLDLSSSDVSDFGLAKVAEICGSLRAIDIRRCDNISSAGVSELVQHCFIGDVEMRAMNQNYYCRGSRNSDRTACRCLDVLKPKLNDVEGDSWEELKTEEIGNVAVTLRWLVWPKIDKDSLEGFSTECPRIIVNPKPSPFGFRGPQVPWEALPDIQLDDSIVKDIDPKTWVKWGFIPRAMPSPLSSPTELPMAENFRLAFEERDTRLVPKCAKKCKATSAMCSKGVDDDGCRKKGTSTSLTSEQIPTVETYIFVCSNHPDLYPLFITLFSASDCTETVKSIEFDREVSILVPNDNFFCIMVICLRDIATYIVILFQRDIRQKIRICSLKLGWVSDSEAATGVMVDDEGKRFDKMSLTRRAALLEMSS